MDEIQCVYAHDFLADNHVDLYRLVEVLGPIFANDQAPWHLDLSGCIGQIGIYALTLIAALTLNSKLQGRAARVTFPVVRPGDVNNYQLSGLSHFVDGAAYPDPENPSSFFAPIERIAESNTFSDANRIISLLRCHAPISQDAEEYVSICINEAIRNVEDHASSRIGVMVGGHFDVHGRIASIAIVDCGIGITSSIKRRYPDFNDAVAVLEKIVIEGGYSSKSRPGNLGAGINNIGNIVTKQLEGVLTIISDDGIVARGTWRWNALKRLPVRFPGTGLFFDFVIRKTEA